MAGAQGDGHPITILFTDVQGSTQLRARHGDRIADEILHDHEAIVRQAISAHGGVGAAFLGDGFMATFGTPAAGLSCAIAIQQGLQQYGRDPVEATGAFSFVDRGLYWLRGFPDRWRLYEAEWGRDDDGGVVRPAQTSFVGRERERADLRRAVEDARVGHGSFVLVPGEAGVGKTRLLPEIDAEADARGLRVLAGHSTKDEGRAP